MTHKEKTVYDFIAKNDDGGGLPAEVYYTRYGGEQLSNGTLLQNIEISKKEFVEIVIKLYEQGYLDKSGTSIGGDDIFTVKKASSNPGRGNLIHGVFEIFASKSEQELMDWAVQTLYDFSDVTGITSIENLMLTVICSAMIGTGGIKVLSSKQKKLIDHVFSTVFNYNGTMESVYNKIQTGSIPESAYKLFEAIGQTGNHEACMPLLYHILCFAYIDGTIKPEISERLENIFGLALMSQIFSQPEEQASAEY
ncbi:MAG: hypothetical protein EGR23_00515 [Holdemanella biformis]|nr:hypothetical protein [Holdemanella biformis]